MSNRPSHHKPRRPHVAEDTAKAQALRVARLDGCVCENPELIVTPGDLGPVVHVGHDSPSCPAFMAPVRWVRA